MSSMVELHPSGHRFQAESGETVLEAALRAGRSPAFGCANGSCGECRARIIEGEVEPVRFHDYYITEADKRAGYALLCSVAPPRRPGGGVHRGVGGRGHRAAERSRAGHARRAGR